MIRRAISFDDFMPNLLGFDHLVDRLTENSSSFPPYDIEKLNDTDYRVTLAVAGFSREQLEITSENGQLTIKGSKVKEEVDNLGKTEYLHKGIAGRSFVRTFSLSEYIEITQVSLQDGLLMIDLTRNVPETAKPKIYEIK